MKKIFLKTTISLSFFYSLNVFSSTCFTTSIKIIFNKKEEVSNEVLCKIKTGNKMLFYASKSCEDEKCKILKLAPRSISIAHYPKDIGSPGFKLCKELGGVPQIFEFLNQEKKWESTERCFLERNDFVEIGLLVDRWKTFIKY